MKHSKIAARLLRTTILTGAIAAVAAPALAQDDDDDVIIITGSRLDQANLNSSSPVFQVDAGEIDSRGVTRVEDLLNVLPQAFAAQTSNLANGASGTSSLNLRGLGATRTLVLVDGKRLSYGAGNAAAVNLDQIPAQLVQRVDIVTGGASAVYGSDAVSGVANFILRRDFEGLELDGQVGFFQDGNNNDFSNELLASNGIAQPGATADGRSVNVAAIFGANTPDGRGNVTAFLQYQDQNEVRQDARDFSACAFAPSGASTAVGGVGCVGSSTFRRFFTPGGDFFLGEDSVLVPFTGAPEQTFNFAPDNFLQRNNERFNFQALARYNVTENIEAFLDLAFTENQTDSQIAFSGTFFRPFQVNCGNPLIQTPVDAAAGGGTLADALGCDAAAIAADTDVGLTAGYRNVTGDPRSSFIGVNTFRLVGGFRGDLNENHSFETFGQFSRTVQNTISTGDLSFADVQDGLFAVDDGSGNVVCRSGNAGCLPFNIFEFNGVSAEAAQFAQGTGLVRSQVEQIVLGGTFTSDLGAYGLKSPFSDNGVNAVVGIEYRRDQLNRVPDDISQIPGGRGLTGVGGGTLPLSGEVAVTELFFETQIPLVSDRPFFHEFGISGAFRYSDYTTDGNGVANSFDTNTFAAGITWSPVPDIRLRAQFQRAQRGPNVFELFTGQNTGLFNAAAGPNGLFDPCAGDLDPTTATPAPSATAAQCAFTGVTAAQFGTIPDNPAGQLNLVTGGNPLLFAESSDTFTVGAVLQPRWIEGFNFAIDYFDISVDDFISTVPPTVALSQCISSGTPEFCSLINRDSFGSLFLSNNDAAGNLAGVFATNTNIANLATRGIDLSSNYSLDLGNSGSVSFNYASTILLELSSVPIPALPDQVFECSGLYRGACGGPNPEYRHRLLATWQTPWNVDVTATWRYFGGVTLDTVDGTGTQLSAGGVFTPTGNVLDDRLDSANYLDLAATWNVKEGVALRAGVNNVLGRDPELSTQAGTAPGNGDTFPGTYDALGRFIFVGVNLSL